MVDPNQSPLDVYTVFHVGFGALARKSGLDLTESIVVSLVWEWVLEPWYKDRYPRIFPAPSQDSTINKITDTLAVAAGWILAGRGQR